jgi:hypothetical protein
MLFPSSSVNSFLTSVVEVLVINEAELNGNGSLITISSSL